MTNKSIEKKISLDNATKIILLRGKIDSLISEVWIVINRKEKEKIQNYVKNYEQTRKELFQMEVALEDIESYDTRFRNLPWEAINYKTPKLSRLK